MKKRHFAVSVVIGLSLVACDKLVGKLKGEQADAAIAAEDAATAPVVQGAVANEKDVTRYGDAETTLDADATTVAATVARTASSAGNIVDSIPSGTSVHTLAKHDKAVLVLFESRGQKLIGWIGADKLPETAAALVPAAEPSKGTTPAATPATTAATKDAGAAPAVVDAGAPKDAGTTPAVVDAGSSTTITDAGTKPIVVDAGTVVVVKDAGAAPAPSGLTSPTRAAKDGKCDAGWIIFPTGSSTCRKPCTADAECAPLKCAAKGSQMLCSVSK